jgi:uncharacterized membrane protein YeaQ/YmgE (transglycosylase-associated protein family)
MYKNQKRMPEIDNKSRIIGIIGALIGGGVGGYISSLLMRNHIFAGIGAAIGYFVVIMTCSRNKKRQR